MPPIKNIDRQVIDPADTDAEAAALKLLTNQLAEIAQGAPSHRLMLVALMSVYKAVATVHPCCAGVAAQAALTVGGQLLTQAVSDTPTGPVH